MGLLEYLRDIYFPNWEIVERTWGKGLFNEGYIISIIEDKDIENAFTDIWKKESHYYNIDVLISLKDIVEILKISRFEIVKEDGKPLQLKYDHFSIFHAPMIMEDDDYEDEEGGE